MLPPSFRKQNKAYVKNYYEFKLPETFDLFCSYSLSVNICTAVKFLRLLSQLASSLSHQSSPLVSPTIYAMVASPTSRSGDTAIATTKFRSIIKIISGYAIHHTQLRILLETEAALGNSTLLLSTCMAEFLPFASRFKKRGNVC